MNKTTSIIFAILVFLLAWLFCSTSFVGSDLAEYGWIIALFIAAVIAVGSYYLFAWIQKRSAASQDKTANELLGPYIPAGEKLLAHVQGYTGPGQTGMVLLFGALGDALINAPRRKYYYLGITAQNLILVQVKGKKLTDVHQVLRRGEVSLTYEAGAFKEPKLILTFAAEKMELRVLGNMVKRAKELAAAWNGAT